jgi:hypothetical protein
MSAGSLGDGGSEVPDDGRLAVPMMRARQVLAVVPVVVRTQGVWCG